MRYNRNIKVKRILGMGIFDSSRVFTGRCVGISNEGAGVVRIEEKGAKEDGMK